MSTHDGNSRPAFTLIELLVVIAILTLLLAMLTPILQQAKQIAVRTQCMANMRRVGQAAWVFAGGHGGRGPGRAYRDIPSGSSVAWANILSAEQQIPIRGQGRTPYRTGDLTVSCPSMEPWPDDPYAWAYEWNLNAVGGPNWEGCPQPQGLYGKQVPVGMVQHMYTNCHLGWYCLGAELERFARPAYKFLSIESEGGGNSTFNIRVDNAPTYSVTLGGGGPYNYPPWTSNTFDVAGQFAFRHTRPNDKALWQTRATANFLFVDLHMEVFNPMARLQKTDRQSVTN